MLEDKYINLMQGIADNEDELYSFLASVVEDCDERTKQLVALILIFIDKSTNNKKKSDALKDLILGNVSIEDETLKTSLAEIREKAEILNPSRVMTSSTSKDIFGVPTEDEEAIAAISHEVLMLKAEGALYDVKKEE